ncbi:hypothetical protein EDC04DRAFT_2801654, partial [Pisolithus marmoratus]
MPSLWDATSLPSAVLTASLSLSLLVSFLVPAWRIPEFTPRQIIYSKNVFPLLLAPWAAHTNDVTRSVSRLVQIALTLCLPQTAILPCYVYRIVIGLARMLTGFLLTCSIGWAYPRLFNHWALYETSSGIGPTLATYLLTSGARPALDLFQGLFKGRHWESSSHTEVVPVICMCTILCWLDWAPWTYTMATLLSILLMSWRVLMHVPFGGFDPQHSSNISPLVRHSRMGFQASLLVLLLIPLPHIFSFLFCLGYNPIPHIAPSSANFTNRHPLIEILVLSFPRPNDAGSTPVLSRTISSHLPYITKNGSTSLSVFTHAQQAYHPSFEAAKKEEGQYLHVAEAFRWVSERHLGNDTAPSSTVAEWVMLVEDNFPLCGEWGWRGIVGVMRILEDNRTLSAPMGRLTID